MTEAELLSALGSPSEKQASPAQIIFRAYLFDLLKVQDHTHVTDLASVGRDISNLQKLRAIRKPTDADYARAKSVHYPVDPNSTDLFSLLLS
ncbi:hypothetical protein [Rathayibacter sp. AY1B5]|uniref:hypothetical protein n=1 Tax=Rathayibacter sp. AY1B5 TaxID=2080530 RepID=UPI000CE8D393|nr:hypothetical protein [Rathayibacter sp. AY1B5]PPI28194.1 hypothetical protein C5D44_00195 [Rathayibacter sp. AY1B5]